MTSWLASSLNDLKNLSEKVQAAIPIDKETLQKLTLNTPELQAERQQMDEEYRHRVAVKDSLAHMFPWETRDSERDILVEECKEAILALSTETDTFFGPYQMPKLNVNTKDKEEEKTEEEKLLEEAEEVDEKEAEIKDRDPSPESQEKLAKLEPLPPLLANFDLHAHVGLIQKMLKADPKLVERQSTLSGGGEREKVFWRNYFFHCAFTRYEAGLSIDEIWSDQPPPPRSDTAVEEEHHTEEEEVHFESAAPAPVAVEETETPKEEATDLAVFGEEENNSSPESVSPSTGADYEIVDSANEDNEDGFGGELDELEAEIARELED